MNEISLIKGLMCNRTNTQKEEEELQKMIMNKQINELYDSLNRKCTS